MDQIVQVLGSLLILSAFVAAQRGRLSTQSRLYLSLNLIGASVLTVLAAHERQLGFLLLEFVWALVAGYSLLQSSLSGSPPARGRSRADCTNMPDG
jgi:hypothetical protein